MRYPTRASQLDHQRLPALPPAMHDYLPAPSAQVEGSAVARVVPLTTDITTFWPNGSRCSRTRNMCIARSGNRSGGSVDGISRHRREPPSDFHSRKMLPRRRCGNDVGSSSFGHTHMKTRIVYVRSIASGLQPLVTATPMILSLFAACFDRRRDIKAPVGARVWLECPSLCIVCTSLGNGLICWVSSRSWTCAASQRWSKTYDGLSRLYPTPSVSALKPAGGSLYRDIS